MCSGVVNLPIRKLPPMHLPTSLTVSPLGKIKRRDLRWGLALQVSKSMKMRGFVCAGAVAAAAAAAFEVPMTRQKLSAERFAAAAQARAEYSASTTRSRLATAYAAQPEALPQHLVRKLKEHGLVNAEAATAIGGLPIIPQVRCRGSSCVHVRIWRIVPEFILPLNNIVVIVGQFLR